jgi:lysophospholipase L1-like esterase
MQYGTVTGRFLAAVGDTSADADRNPDEVPLVGKVAFTAELPKGRALQVVGQKATILPVPITCTLDAQGYLVQNGVRSVNLIATDTDETNPRDFTYKVTFTGLTYAGTPVSYGPFSIAVPAGQTIDLSVVAPVSSSNGVPIIRGEDGLTGAPGAPGKDGKDGLPGVNAVENDTAVAEYISTPNDSATKAAVLARLRQRDIIATRERSVVGSVLGRASLPKFFAAVDRVKAGTTDAKVLCLGDSTTAGVGSDPALFGRQGGPDSYPAVLARVLGRRVPTTKGLAIPQSTLTLPANPDSRWSVISGTTWQPAPYSWGRGADWASTEGAAGVLGFADPDVLADRFDVYYIKNTGLGNFIATATGGAPTVVQSNSGVAYPGVGSRLVGRSTIAATALARTNTLRFEQVTSGPTTPNHIVGVEPFDSTRRTVRIGNAGVGGSTAGDWTNNGDLFGAAPAIQAYAPDLTIISLGINDSNRPLDPATVAANVKTIAAVAAQSGDVVIMSPIPSATSSRPQVQTYEAQYNAAYAGLGYPFLNLFTRFGAPGDPLTTILGMFTPDGLHPNAQGYADIAGYLAEGIAAGI